MNKLPKYCVTTSLATGRVVGILRGVRLIYFINTSSFTARQINADLGVSLEQEKAMYYGALFGFDQPGANPENYDSNGKRKRSA